MVHQKWCIIQLDTEYEDEMDIADEFELFEQGVTISHHNDI